MDETKPSQRTVNIEMPSDLADRIENRLLQEPVSLNDLYVSMVRTAFTKNRWDEKLEDLTARIEQMDDLAQRLDNYIVRANLVLNELSRFVIPDEEQYREFLGSRPGVPVSPCGNSRGLLFRDTDQTK